MSSSPSLRAAPAPEPALAGGPLDAAHTPVLPEAVSAALLPARRIVDGTLGAGGHSQALLAGGAEQALKRGQNRWRSAPLLLASSHLARMRSNRDELLDGSGWDLVFVDETHHARRRGSKPTDKPNEMLATLMALREENLFEALLLASATPMQLNTCDLWDLLNLFGLPPVWRAGAVDMERYYQTLQEPVEDRDWRLLQRMLAGHLNDVDPDPDVV